MSVFDDLSKFLEARLDEFLKANPQLELLALEEQLRGQEEDAVTTFSMLKRRQQQIEASILETAEEVKRWHLRIQKAKSAQRLDLVGPAQEREAALLREGNHLWGQMKGVKEKMGQTQVLQQQIKTKRQELKARIAQEAANRAARPAQEASTTGWQQAPYSFNRRPIDPLEESFQRWETEAELEELKRQMGK